MKSRFLASAFLLLVLGASLQAQDRFPRPEFQSGYQEPQATVPSPRSNLFQIVDIVFLACALAASALAVLRFRSRLMILIVSAASLAYLGFWKRGCICPIGSVQNVSAALAGTGPGVGLYAAALFLLPLIASLFLGRVFCAGVCPFGALQEFLLIKPIRLPPLLESILSLVPPLFLGLAVFMAATGSGFPICRLDPFVGLFRMSYPVQASILGLAFLASSLFIARPYCRWLCPYGAIHAAAAFFSRRHAEVSPASCVDCGLCGKSCPIGAIQGPIPEPGERAAIAGRAKLAKMILLVPAFIAGGAVLGYLCRPIAYALNPDIALKIALDKENTFTRGSTLRTRTYLASKADDEAFAKKVESQKAASDIGMTILGAYSGAVVFFFFARPLMRRKREGYSVDRLACVSCARCFDDCPVERPDGK
jgi:NAD-dependent dihydropyrimidine dehydrogenase PreA subunit